MLNSFGSTSIGKLTSTHVVYIAQKTLLTKKSGLSCPNHDSRKALVSLQQCAFVRMTQKSFIMEMPPTSRK